MVDHGFYISKLCLRGPSKDDAVLAFAEGLNVVSGPSDTGKTFVFQCINYAFGGSDRPKDIEESDGYGEVFLELTSYQGTIVTVKRSLTDKKMLLYDCALEDIYHHSPTLILDKHDKDNDSNISSVLLNLTGAEYQNVVKNKKGHTQRFTFRDFAHVSLLSESRMIGGTSPVFDGLPMNKTRNVAAFRAIVTGQDDSAFEGNQASDAAKKKAQAQLEVIDALILESRMDLMKLPLDTSVHFQIETIESRINEVRMEIIERNDALRSLENSKEKAWQELQKTRSERQLLTEVRSRFDLLKKNYESDIERLEFAEDAEYYLGQLANVQCPVWHGMFRPSAQNVAEIAWKAEHAKVKVQLEDLTSTMEQVNIDISELRAKEGQLDLRIQECDALINGQLRPVLERFGSEIAEMIRIRDAAKLREYTNHRMEELLEARRPLQKMASTITVEGANTAISPVVMQSLCQLIQTILEEWKLEPQVKVEFDESMHDLIVNGKSKRSFGKGYASIINSAFVVGVLLYTKGVGLPHPKVVVLDSPLTAYKGVERPSSSDEVGDEVKLSFFRHLSRFSLEVQFIVLDNAVPPVDVQMKATYHRFTKSTTVGRYGFFPVAR